MFGLTVRLALTNLKKNRRLYFPYALMTILSTAIAYIFASLAFHPDLGQVKGADGVTMVLGFGMIVVMLAVAIMVFYANSLCVRKGGIVNLLFGKVVGVTLMPIITQLTCDGNQISGNKARWETHKLMSYHITTE